MAVAKEGHDAWCFQNRLKHASNDSNADCLRKHCGLGFHNQRRMRFLGLRRRKLDY